MRLGNINELRQSPHPRRTLGLEIAFLGAVLANFVFSIFFTIPIILLGLALFIWPPPQPLSFRSKELYSMLGSLLIVGLQYHSAHANWFNAPADTLNSSRWYLLLPLAFLLLLRFSVPSWKHVFTNPMALPERDERELYIRYRVNTITLAIAVTFMVALASLIFVFPQGTNTGVASLIAGTLFLLFFINRFLAWRMGLR